MRIENVYAPPSFDGSEGLLATIVYKSLELSCENKGAVFYTNPELPLQVAKLIHPTGMIIEPHTHLPVIRELIGTPEILFIQKGKVRLDLYLSDGAKIISYDLGAGDIAILIQGGHGLTILESAEILEVKQGPYMGRLRDKQFIKSISKSNSIYSGEFRDE